MSEVNELVVLRVFHMPCCGHELCWINPRLPSHCPECGELVYLKLKTGKHTIFSQETWLRAS